MPLRQDRIYLSPPDVGAAEREAVVRAVDSGWIAPLGPEVDAFEAELAEFSQRGQTVALSSGTAALHLGLLLLGVEPGDVVVTSTLTFAATAFAIDYVQARGVFVDCDSTGNMDPDLLRAALEQLERDGDLPKAIIPVDLLGKIAAQERISAVAAAFDIPILSDAAESLGAVRLGQPAASHGTMAVLSFNGNKIVTTSGGGALLSDNPDLAARARHLSNQARQPLPWYEHKEIGYNYRMSNVLAALGRAQLSRLPQMMARRHQHRLAYQALFSRIPGVEIFGEPSGSIDDETHDNWWLTTVLVDPNEAGFAAEDLRQALEAESIEARRMWQPMHRQPVFARALAFLNGTADSFYQQGLSLPSGSGLTPVQFDQVCDAIERFAGSVTGPGAGGDR
ncbi:MAG: aminotransferase class I/II-fold pyridoxal phosphate-dependent enzyme [Micrococcales bacterium]|nr:aminotransferase class I/II-fold pyridoxal phosphate-dependent enzyme [Micrococcales bacterium]